MLEFIEQLNPQEMDAFTTHHPQCHLLQSSNWALVKDNWQHLFVGVKNKGELVASALILIKTLPLKLTMFYIPRGPIMDYGDSELVSFMMEHITALAKKHHCLYIKMDPFILKNQYSVETANDSTRVTCTIAIKHLEQANGRFLGFSKDIIDTIQPRYHANVYTCEDYAENLPRHTQKLIKVALKRNVEIVSGSLEYLDDFEYVVQKTQDRKQIALRSKDYFELLLNTYKQDAKITMAYVDLKQLILTNQQECESRKTELAELPVNQVKKKKRLEEEIGYIEKDIREFSALYEKNKKDKVPIAGCLSVRFGNTVEMLYAGMDEDYRKFMPQYLIYIDEIQTAFSQGVAWYNLGGVEGSLDDGLTKFKHNFNPTIDEFVGEFDFPVNKLLYKLSQTAYNIRKRKG